MLPSVVADRFQQYHGSMPPLLRKNPILQRCAWHWVPSRMLPGRCWGDAGDASKRPGLATRWYNKLLNGTRARLGKKLLQKQDSANLAPQYGSIALDHSCSPAIPCMVNLSDVHGIPIRCKDLLNVSFWTLSIYLVCRRIKFAKENFHLLHDSIWIWLNMIEWYWMWLNMIECDWILFTSDYLSPQCQPKPGTDLQNPHKKVGRPV